MSGRLRADLDGRYITSPAGFVVLLPYSAVSMVLSNPDLRLTSLSMRFTVAVAGQVFLFALLIVWRWAASRWRPWPTGTAQTLLAFAAASALRAVFVAWLLRWTGVTPSIDWGHRLSGSIIGFTAALAIVDAVVGSVRRHRDRMSMLRSQEAAAMAARDASLVAMKAQRDDVAQRIRVQFLQQIDGIAGADPSSALSALQKTASEVVRPLSHELATTQPWSSAPIPMRPQPRFDATAFLDDATRGTPVRPLMSAVLFICFGGPFLLVALPPARALPLLMLGFALIWIMLTLTNAILRRVPDGTPIWLRAVLLVALVVSSGVVLSASSLLFVTAPGDVLARVMIGDLLLVPTIALALVAARAAQAQEREHERQLQVSVADLDRVSTRAACMQWRQQRALARAVHGPIQSAVGSAVIRLERAVLSGEADAALLATLRTDLVDVINGFDADATDQPRLTFTLAEFANTWDGVCDIRWAITPAARAALARDSLAHFAAKELATEGCWNAIRHAHATRVEISLDAPHPDVLQLRVCDDGVPSNDAEPSAGLGTRMLNDMTLSWLRTRNGGRTEVVATIPSESS